MHLDEFDEIINSLKFKAYDCYDNANCNDEALKKCTHLETFYKFFTMCDGCCNRDICAQYAEEEKSKHEASFSYYASIPSWEAVSHTIDEIYRPIYYTTSF